MKRLRREQIIRYIKLAAIAFVVAIISFPIGLAISGPEARVEGVVSSIAAWRGKGETRFSVSMDGDRTFEWRCGSRTCNNAEAVLKSRALQWSLPAKAVLTVRGDEVAALRIGDTVVISEDLARTWHQTNILMASGVIGIAVAAGLSLLLDRYRPRRLRAAAGKRRPLKQGVAQ